MGGKGDFEGREVIEVMLESANIETTRTVATATFIGGAPENAFPGRSRAAAAAEPIPSSKYIAHRLG
jgi:hypothetical protein